MLKNNNNKIKNKAFTLVELMVTISIFLIITSTVIVNYSDFKSTVSLQNITDDIALSIRKAQSFAIGARAVSSNFNNSYGMHFSVESGGIDLDGSSKSFLLFSIPPTKPKKQYNNTGACGTDNECIELFKIISSDKIEGILLDGSVTTDDKASIDIIFTRPDPRAYFCYKQVSNSSSACNSDISSVGIIISNGQTGTKKKGKMITVQNTGQISIQPYVF